MRTCWAHSGRLWACVPCGTHATPTLEPLNHVRILLVIHRDPGAPVAHTNCAPRGPRGPIRFPIPPPLRTLKAPVQVPIAFPTGQGVQKKSLCGLRPKKVCVDLKPKESTRKPRPTQFFFPIFGPFSVTQRLRWAHNSAENVCVPNRIKTRIGKLYYISPCWSKS